MDMPETKRGLARLKAAIADLVAVERRYWGWKVMRLAMRIHPSLMDELVEGTMHAIANHEMSPPDKKEAQA